MFGFIYHIINLQRLLLYTFLDFKYTGEVSLSLIRRCKNEIINSGFVVIKLCQWSLPRLQIIYDLEEENWYKELENVYDNCYIHEDSYTKDLYQLSTGVEFDIKYEILDIVASGSIGQVYKIRDKETEEIRALKCKHPNTNIHYYSGIFVIRLISLFITLFKRLHYRIFPVDLETFFYSLRSQVYLSNEAINLKRMYKNFENNEYIIIPELYEYNDDIIVMKYIPSVKYQDIQITQNNKYKLSYLLNLSLRQMVVIDKFVHGDLHKGNWGIYVYTEDNEERYKLVYYDMGYCFNVKNSKLLFEAFEDPPKMETMTNVISQMTTDVYNRDISDLKKIIKENFIDRPLNPIEDNNFTNSVVIFCKQNGYILHGYFISIGIILEQLNNILQQFVVGNKVGTKTIKGENQRYTEIIVKKGFSDIVAFCDTNKIFLDLSDYYKEKIQKENVTRNAIFEGSDYSNLIDISTAIMS